VQLFFTNSQLLPPVFQLFLQTLQLHFARLDPFVKLQVVEFQSFRVAPACSFSRVNGIVFFVVFHLKELLLILFQLFF
jgi:hypothetical protein